MAVYAELARLHGLGRAPFRRAETFNLDELLLSPEDPRSFRAFMERHLFSKVGIPAGRIHFLRGDADDLALGEAAAQRAGSCGTWANGSPLAGDTRPDRPADLCPTCSDR